jgi:hypothetical protein
VSTASLQTTTDINTQIGCSAVRPGPGAGGAGGCFGSARPPSGAFAGPRLWLWRFWLSASTKRRHAHTRTRYHKHKPHTHCSWRVQRTTHNAQHCSTHAAATRYPLALATTGHTPHNTEKEKHKHNHTPHISVGCSWYWHGFNLGFNSAELGVGHWPLAQGVVWGLSRANGARRDETMHRSPQESL